MSFDCLADSAESRNSGHCLVSKKLLKKLTAATQQWILTWKCKMIVQMSPSVSFGFPSVMSSGRMFTSLTCFLLRKLSAVSTFCSMWNRSLPFSRGCGREWKLVYRCDWWLVRRYLQVSRSTKVQATSINSDHLLNLETSRRLCLRPCVDDCWSISWMSSSESHRVHLQKHFFRTQRLAKVYFKAWANIGWIISESGNETAKKTMAEFTPRTLWPWRIT